MNPVYGCKGSKYKAKPTEYNGRVYASMAEAARARDLDLLKQAGKVAWWLPQVRFVLGNPQDKNVFIVDFLVAEPTCFGSAVIVHAEDVKGFETQKFKHIKHLWALYGPMPLNIIGKKQTEYIP